MATFAKVKLSGSTDGKQIKVAATGTPGTLIHTAVTGTTNWDEVYLWASNKGAADQAVTIEFGGVGSPDDLMTVTVPASGGYVLLVPGLILQNANVIRAFAASANEVLIVGFVNRITA